MRRVAALLLLAALAASSAQARELKPYAGDPAPPPLALADLAGTIHQLAEYRSRVVLVNFWASWCPPCVHELPSMQRLAQRLQGRPFTILAVDMGESEADVRRFLEEEVQVDFTVLLDGDGSALREWKVFAFPTSFVIGPDGRIRYALFGALDWDAPEVIAKITGLLPGG